LKLWRDKEIRRRSKVAEDSGARLFEGDLVLSEEETERQKKSGESAPAQVRSAKRDEAGTYVAMEKRAGSECQRQKETKNFRRKARD